MTIDQALKELYKREINCSLSSFWDGGWEIKIGDELNGYTAGATGVELEDIAETLLELAKIESGTAFGAIEYNRYNEQK